MEYVEAQNKEFADPEESPLLEKAQKGFKYVNYYPYNPKYCVAARLVQTPGEAPFEMPTSTERLPVYVKYGELHFTIDGKDLKLAVYQSLSLMETEGYEDYLFVPFNDLTNGDTSYGGGRYFDFRIPEDGTYQLNLNNTYHPLCAYNHRYSCPIPPEENMLDVAIEAGVKLGINGRRKMKH
jgi:uncharacterized protein (DUF1684 family)